MIGEAFIFTLLLFRKTRGWYEAFTKDGKQVRNQHNTRFCLMTKVQDFAPAHWIEFSR